MTTSLIFVHICVKRFQHFNVSIYLQFCLRRKIKIYKISIQRSTSSFSIFVNFIVALYYYSTNNCCKRGWNHRFHRMATSQCRVTENSAYFADRFRGASYQKTRNPSVVSVFCYAISQDIVLLSGLRPSLPIEFTMKLMISRTG